MRAALRWKNAALGAVTTMLLLLVWNGRALGQQPCGSTVPTNSKLHPGPAGATATPLTMLAFGTSLMWGDGLLEPETFRYKVADWVAEQAGRPVQLTTFAHSAALLSPPGPGSTAPVNPAPSIGDLNNPLPSLDEQIECAANTDSFRHAGLVLVEGCINDVGAESIVYPWTDNDVERRDEAVLR